MFLPHGEYHLTIEDDLMFIEARGPFNVEVVDQYMREVAVLIQQMQPPWGQIITLHQDSLFTPEAEQLMYKMVADRKQSGVVASAVVMLNPKGQFVVEQQVGNIYQQSQVSHRYFRDYNAALCWVREQISICSQDIN